jgi:hypothetical protein
MKHTFNIARISFCILIFATLACSDSKGPAIKIDGEKYKFGEVTAGQEVVFTFYYSNPGTRDLVIEDLYVSCFCVTVKQYDKTVKPGSKGKIYGVIKTEGFEGEVSKSIKLKTNIPNVEPVITMEGKILPKK